MGIKNYERLSRVVFNQPLLCTKDYAETLVAVLGDRLGVDSSGFEVLQDEKPKRGIELSGDGTLVIPILGSMTHRASFLDAASGIQSYDSIQSMIQEGLDNPEVKSIVLDMDSPGGSANGAFDLRDFILEAKKEKPIYALAHDTMASAAYLIGSAATKVYATQTGHVGSIGVVALHLDKSEQVSKLGVKPTFIYAGDYKVSGSDLKPLDEKSYSYLKESIDETYEMFVNAVSEARGLDPQVIKDTQARVYSARKSRELGLIDGVRTLDTTIKELAKFSQGRVLVDLKGVKMENDLEKLQADLNEAKAERDKLVAMLKEKGFELTDEGLKPLEKEELIEVEGEMVSKASIPAPVLKALEKAAAEKRDQMLTEKAKDLLPNFNLEAAKKLLSADLDDETLEALKAADAALAMTMEEKGEKKVDGDMISPKEKLDALVQEFKDQGMTKEQAFAKVAATQEGAKLIREAFNKEMK